MRTVQTVAGVAALFIYLVYWNFGTGSPCGMLRETVRQRDGMTVRPPGGDAELDIEAQNPAQSSAQCLSLFVSQKQVLLPIAHLPASHTSLQAVPQSTSRLALANLIARSSALAEAEHAVDECRAKHLTGELPTYAAAVRRSNPHILPAFNAVNYSYQDLIQILIERRLAWAQKNTSWRVD